MKVIKKDELEARFSMYNYKATTGYTVLNKPLAHYNNNFHRKLSIVIPGPPIIDSRPRYTSVSNSFYNPHKANLMKVFKTVYDESDILNTITIMSPMVVHLRIYTEIPKVYRKHLSKNDLKRLVNGDFLAFSKPDNDNVEKVHFDVLQDYRYGIIMRDENIVSNTSTKFFVNDKFDQRVEIDIYYNDIPSYARSIIVQSADYLKYSLSLKNKVINNIDDKDFAKFFYKTIVEHYKKTKSKQIEKVIRFVLEYYDIETLSLLANGQNRNTRIDNVIKMAQKLIGGLSKC